MMMFLKNEGWVNPILVKMNNAAWWELVTYKSDRSPLVSSSEMLVLGCDRLRTPAGLWHKPCHSSAVRGAVGILFQGCFSVGTFHFCSHTKTCSLPPESSEYFYAPSQGVSCLESVQMKKAFTTSPQPLLAWRLILQGRQQLTLLSQCSGSVRPTEMQFLTQCEDKYGPWSL